MAFIEPMHRNKPNITYLLTPPKHSIKSLTTMLASDNAAFGITYTMFPFIPHTKHMAPDFGMLTRHCYVLECYGKVAERKCQVLFFLPLATCRTPMPTIQNTNFYHQVLPYHTCWCPYTFQNYEINQFTDHFTVGDLWMTWLLVCLKMMLLVIYSYLDSVWMKKKTAQLSTLLQVPLT